MRKLVLLIAFFVATTLVVIPQPKAAAGVYYDSSPSAIMMNGARDPDMFINKVKAQKKYKDLQRIYAEFGLHSQNYQAFADDAVEGTIYATDGRIKVNGQVVGRSLENISRVRNNEFTRRLVIGGKTYYVNAFTNTNHANEQPIMVWFDANGVARIAILNSTGAPQKMWPVNVHPKCIAVHKQGVQGRPNAYDFTTKASADSGAKVVGVEYDFGDGTVDRTNNGATPFRHRFAKDSTVTARPLFKMPGSGKVITIASASCQTRVDHKQAKAQPAQAAKQVAKPAVVTSTTSAQAGSVCSQLTATLSDAASNTYQFSAQAAKPTSGVKLMNATYNFGDGTITTGIVPINNQVPASHGYQPGNYTVTATLNFTNAAGNTVTDACQVNIAVTNTQAAAAAPATTVAADDEADDDAAAAATATPAAATDDAVLADDEDAATTDDGEDRLINTGSGEIAVGAAGLVGVVGAVGHWFFRRRLGM